MLLWPRPGCWCPLWGGPPNYASFWGLEIWVLCTTMILEILINLFKILSSRYWPWTPQPLTAGAHGETDLEWGLDKLNSIVSSFHHTYRNLLSWPSNGVSPHCPPVAPLSPRLITPDPMRFTNTFPQQMLNEETKLYSNLVSDSPREIKKKKREILHPHFHSMEREGNCLSSHTHHVIVTLGYPTTLSSSQSYNMKGKGW